jgi:hypothetical protein
MGRTENPHLGHMRFPFPKGCKDGKGRVLKSIIIRETCEEDEERARRAADASKALGFGVALYQESVVAIRYADSNADVEIDAPDPDRLDGWPTKSRDFAVRCFHKVNSIGDDEAEASLGEAEAVDPTTLRMTTA